jgi:hypothetical protein
MAMALVASHGFGLNQFPGERLRPASDRRPHQSNRTAQIHAGELPLPSHVRLEVFTTLGQQIGVVVDAEKPAGYHDFAWNSDATSGVYYFRLIAAPLREPGKQYTATRKMVLMR